MRVRGWRLWIGLCLALRVAPIWAASPLRVGMVPDAGATQVSIEQKAPLQAYLAQQIGRPVELIIPANYNATVEGLGNASLDVAYLGGLTYIKAHARYGVIPLVQRAADREFHSLFITLASSRIMRLADLRGHSFAFGDINSTSGHLMPYLAMREAGIDPKRDLAWFRYTGSHPATAQSVAAGVADAGAIDESVYRALAADGKIDASRLRVFYTTPAFVDYVWVARPGLDPALQGAITTAFTRLAPGHDTAILAILRGAHFVPADDAEYTPLRQVARQLGLD